MNRHPNAVTDALDASDVEAGETPVPRRMATDRMVLRRVHPESVAVDRFHDLFADAADEVFELCGWDAHDDEAETRAYLDRRADQWADGTFYEYVLETAADGEYVGTACLELCDDGSADFGFWLRRPFWGRGFCGEGVDALVHAAFECLDAPYVVAGCLPANDRSRRAIEKFVRRYGGAYYGTPPRASGGEGDEGDEGNEGDEGDEGDEETAVTSRHEWVITREQYDAGERGISTPIPGVAYEDVAFDGG